MSSENEWLPPSQKGDNHRGLEQKSFAKKDFYKKALGHFISNRDMRPQTIAI